MGGERTIILSFLLLCFFIYVICVLFKKFVLLTAFYYGSKLTKKLLITFLNSAFNVFIHTDFINFTELKKVKCSDNKNPVKFFISYSNDRYVFYKNFKKIKSVLSDSFIKENISNLFLREYRSKYKLVNSFIFNSIKFKKIIHNIYSTEFCFVIVFFHVICSYISDKVLNSSYSEILFLNVVLYVENTNPKLSDFPNADIVSLNLLNYSIDKELQIFCFFLITDFYSRNGEDISDNSAWDSISFKISFSFFYFESMYSILYMLDVFNSIDFYAIVIKIIWFESKAPIMYTWFAKIRLYRFYTNFFGLYDKYLIISRNFSRDYLFAHPKKEPRGYTYILVDVNSILNVLNSRFNVKKIKHYQLICFIDGQNQNFFR